MIISRASFFISIISSLPIISSDYAADYFRFQRSLSFSSASSLRLLMPISFEEADFSSDVMWRFSLWGNISRLMGLFLNVSSPMMPLMWWVISFISTNISFDVADFFIDDYRIFLRFSVGHFRWFFDFSLFVVFDYCHFHFASMLISDFSLRLRGFAEGPDFRYFSFIISISSFISIV